MKSYVVALICSLMLAVVCVSYAESLPNKKAQCFVPDIFPCDKGMSSMVKEFSQIELDSIAQKNWVVKKIDNKDSLLRDTCHFFFEYTFKEENKNVPKPEHMDSLEYSCKAIAKGYRSVNILAKNKSKWFGTNGQVTCDYGIRSRELKMKRSFNNGLLNGVTEIYNNSERLIQSISYKDNLRDGEEKVFSGYNDFVLDDFVAQIRTFSLGKLNGVSKIYNNSGELFKIFTYKNGLRDGEERTYSAEGGFLIRIRFYSEDKLNGLETEYNQYGNKIRESQYKDDVMLFSTEYGDYQHYESSDDCVSKNKPLFCFSNECLEKMKRKCSCEERYDEKGFVKEETSYKNGKPHGLKFFYYTPCDEKGNDIGSNKKFKELPYENGLLNGVVKEFYPNGKLWSTITYENGEAVSEKKCFSKKGKIQKTGTEKMKCD